MSRPLIQSAVAIPIVAREGGGSRVLVGRRNPKSRFLGGFFAFPGGVIEPEDGDLATEDEMTVLRRTAVRELHEETGLDVSAEELLPAGWRVTPPFTPRRFETKMFLAPVEREFEPAPPIPGELIDLHWETPENLFARWRALEIRIAPPLLLMLRRMTELDTNDPHEIATALQDVNVERPEIGPRIEFVPGVHMVTVRTPTLPPATHTNCFLVGAKEFVVLDPGSGDRAEIDRLLRQIDARRADGASPSAVVLTHHHGDHVAGARPVAEALGVPVRAHPETWARWAEGASLRPADGGGDLHDGDTIRLSGGEELRLLHTPGHAAGHLALYETKGRSLFAGDLVSGVSTILVDSPSGSLDQYLASLERVRELGAETMFPAHGPPLIAPAKALDRLLRHRQEREEKVLAAVVAGERDLASITRAAYADTPGANPGLAQSQAEAHLDRLERAGRVVRRAAGDYEVA